MNIPLGIRNILFHFACNLTFNIFKINNIFIVSLQWIFYTLNFLKQFINIETKYKQDML